MARIRKPQPTLDTLFFSTPEQKVLRFLLSEPTTAFMPRVISSKLKGVRGLGGVEGIVKILNDLEAIGLVDWVDNRRAVRIQDENPTVQMMKVFSAVCDLEGLKSMLQPLSTKGVLFGSRSTGKARSDSDYDLVVVTESPDEVLRIASQHPLGKKLELAALTHDRFVDLRRNDGALYEKISRGIVVWGSTW